MGPAKTAWSVRRVALAAYARGATQGEAAELVGVGLRTVNRWVAEEAVVVLRDHKPRAGALTLEHRIEIQIGIEQNRSTPMNHPGSVGDSGYWFPTPVGVACWAA